MIYVKRAKCPKSLDGKSSLGGVETKAAIAAIHAGEDFEFTAYKSPDVVDTLRSMFNNKCAYCEFNYAAGTPEDIEHYRPKGGIVINGKLCKPGYYWLAATWENLLPSCPDCNRRRTKLFRKGKEKSGKANFFPLANEAKRRRTNRARSTEEPLLLNPCDDRPNQYLEFLPGGLVREKGTTTHALLRGKVSIEVLGLSRKDLVDQRRSKEVFVTAAVENALAVAEIASRTHAIAAKQELDALAKKLLRDARMHLAADQPYLAVSRAVFKRYGLRV